MPKQLISLALRLLLLAPLPACADRLSEELAQLERTRKSGDLTPKTIQLPAGQYDGPLQLDEALVGDGLLIRGSPEDPHSVVVSAGRTVTDWKVENGRWSATVDVPEVFRFFVNESPRQRCREPEDVIGTVPDKAQAMTLRGRPGRVLSKLHLEGLTFSHAHWQPPERGYAAGQATGHDSPPEHMRRFVGASVEADFCAGLTFTKCLFRNSDGAGLWLREGCEGGSVTNCRFEQLGGNGIMIGEPGNSRHVTRAVSVGNSLIENCGTRYFGAVGVWIGIAADCTLQDNEIRNLPYTGVSVGWRWNPGESPCRGHLIERNHIHHVMRTLSDGGGIYTLGRQPGTILRVNHIHHVSINAGRAESNGIFMDEGSTDILVEGNHIHDIARSPIRFHRAGKNILRNNRLVPTHGIPALRFNNTEESNIIVE